MINEITIKVLNNIPIEYDEAKILVKSNLEDLCKGADKIKNKFCGKSISLCSIISGKGGNCSENCKFCAQSAHYKTNINSFNFIDIDTIYNDCINHYKKGVHRYSIVTSGRTLNDNDFEKAVNAYSKIHKDCNIALCGSHGLLNYEQLKKLKSSGVTRYHCNIETSKEYFQNICTTHSFDEKIRTINDAKKAGLEICSGGIIGMGETMEDRISMAFTLRDLKVSSIPINILTPIPNTPFENNIILKEDEILRTIAIFRYINPNSEIRVAAGRNRLKNKGISAFYSGANATITGDYLTTTGSTIYDDIKMFKENNFEI